MIENHQATIDLLTQISAVKGALDSVGDDILFNYLQDRITEVSQKSSTKDMQQNINEILKVISRMQNK